jgi:aquaporin Z
MNKQMQMLLAEVFGTFILVFIGAGAVIGFGAGAAPFAFGLGLIAALYAFAEICGGHFNPAVTLGLFLDRRLGAAETVMRWIAQVVGAVLAGLGLLLMTSSDDVAKAATVPGEGGVRAAIFVEIICTAIFVLVILEVTTSKGFASTTYVAIGLTLLAIHFIAVPFSGSSVNPARSFGTALIGNHWTDFWIYIVGPPVGAILGWVIYAIVVKGDTNLRDDWSAMRSEISSARRGGAGESEPGSGGSTS